MSSLAWIALSMAAISRTLVEGTWLKILRYQCTLCRCRHNVHYAELRIMPTSTAKPAWEAVIAVEKAA
jgi:hypothetical protein